MNYITTGLEKCFACLDWISLFAFKFEEDLAFEDVPENRARMQVRSSSGIIRREHQKLDHPECVLRYERGFQLEQISYFCLGRGRWL
jgi:hypothetical protein